MYQNQNQQWQTPPQQQAQPQYQQPPAQQYQQQPAQQYHQQQAQQQIAGPMDAPAGAIGSPFGNSPALKFADLPVNAQIYGEITKVDFSDNEYNGQYKGRQAVVTLRVDHAPHTPENMGKEFAVFLTSSRYKDFLSSRVGVGDKWGFNYLGRVPTKMGQPMHKLGQFAEKVTPQEAPTDPFPHGSKNQDLAQQPGQATNARPIYNQPAQPPAQPPAQQQYQAPMGQPPMTQQYQAPMGQPPMGQPPVQQPPVQTPPVQQPAPMGQPPAQQQAAPPIPNFFSQGPGQGGQQ